MGWPGRAPNRAQGLWQNGDRASDRKGPCCLSERHLSLSPRPMPSCTMSLWDLQTRLHQAGLVLGKHASEEHLSNKLQQRGLGSW